MFAKIRDNMPDKIRRMEYVMTLHAEEEMTNDGLTVFDVENAILTGDIAERQKDRASGEWKYVVTGAALTGVKLSVVAKLSRTAELVIITVYPENYEYEQ